MDAKGIVLTPSQVFQLRQKLRVEQLANWKQVAKPITGSIGAYEGLPIVELPIGRPAPDGYLDLREID